MAIFEKKNYKSKKEINEINFYFVMQNLKTFAVDSNSSRACVERKQTSGENKHGKNLVVNTNCRSIRLKSWTYARYQLPDTH